MQCFVSMISWFVLSALLSSPLATAPQMQEGEKAETPNAQLQRIQKNIASLLEETDDENSTVLRQSLEDLEKLQKQLEQDAEGVRWTWTARDEESKESAASDNAKALEKEFDFRRIVAPLTATPDESVRRFLEQGVRWTREVIRQDQLPTNMPQFVNPREEADPN